VAIRRVFVKQKENNKSGFCHSRQDGKEKTHSCKIINAFQEYMGLKINLHCRESFAVLSLITKIYIAFICIQFDMIHKMFKFSLVH